MKQYLKDFGINMFIASPVLAALILIYGLVGDLEQTPWCAADQPREVPQCLPDVLDEEAITSMLESDTGLYMACERHERSKQAKTKYVVAALELQ